MDLNKFLQKMPKIELHAHLNGSLNIDSIRELSEQLYGANTEEFNTLCKQFITFDKKDNLNDCFRKFKFMHELTATRKGLSLATQLVIRDFAKDNVIYLELRTTPKQNAHMTRREYLECVIEAIENARETYSDIHVKLLPSIDRSQPLKDAQETVQLAIEYKERVPQLITGLDLSGNPSCGNFNDFIPLLEQARAAGLKLTLHCAEIENATEVEAMVAYDGMSRCGHGTFLTATQIELLKQRNVAIECCLTSNVKSATVSSYNDHHLKRIMAAECPTVLCTDDSGVFDTTLTEEFILAAKTFDLSRLQCLQLTKNAVKHIFATEAERQALQEKIEAFCLENL